jgi:xanthine dehydrogenase YagS FAD-binding subunit
MHPFSYQKVSSVDQAASAIAKAGERARFLAGGTTLFDLMKLGVENPPTVIDITGIGDLNAIDVSRDEIVIGSLALMADVAAHGRIKEGYPALSESLWKAASAQIRNMATVGGNLLQRTRCTYFRDGEPFACNKRRPGSGCSAIGGVDRALAILGTSDSCIANYPGDWAVALVAFDASVDVVGANGERTIRVEDLHVLPGKTPYIETVLEPGEMIVRIRVPATDAGKASTYHKIRDRESYAFALTSAAVAIVVEGDTVREARIALGGVATKPWRARNAEQSLIGKKLSPESAKAAGSLAFSDAKPGRLNQFRIPLGAQTVADALMIAKGRA